MIRFEITPFEVAPQGEVRIEWSVQDAQRVTLSGARLQSGELQPEGTLAYTPEESELLTLVAQGAGGEVRAQATVRIRAPQRAQILEFTATPTKVRPLEPVRIRWRTQGARAVVLLASDGSVLNTDAEAAGNFVIRPTEDVVITLRAESDSAPQTAEAVVEVTPNTPLIDRFFASPNVVVAGEGTTLNWQTQNAATIELLELTDAEPRSLLQIDLPSGIFDVEATVTTSPAREIRTFVLRAQNSAGNVAEDRALVVVLPIAAPRIAEFTVNPTITGPGGQLRTSWETENAERVELREGGAVLFDDAPRSGQALVQPRVSTNVTLLAVDAGRGGNRDLSRSATVAVTVDPSRPEIISARLEPSTVEPGGSTALFFEVANTDQLELVTDAGQVLLQTISSSGQFPLNPQNSQLYQLRATNAQGQSVRYLSVQVLRPPRILTFSASAQVRVGRTARFQWALQDDAVRSLSLGPHPQDNHDLSSSEGTARMWLPNGVLPGEQLRAELTVQNGPYITTATLSVDVLEAANAGVELEPNDTVSTAQGSYSTLPSRIEGEIQTGDLDLFELSRLPGDRVLVHTEPEAGCVEPLAIDVYEYYPRAGLRGPMLTLDNGDCPSLDARIHPQVANLYLHLMLAIRAPAGAPERLRPYSLSLDVEPELCGDGFRGLIEECDDGNNVSQDGCNASCKFEDLDESEPNHSPQLASILGEGTSFAGRLAIGDNDWYRLIVPVERAGLHTIIVEAPDSGQCALDAELTLYDEEERPLAHDDGEGQGCPSITANLSAGLHLLRIGTGRGVRPGPPRTGRYRFTLFR